RPKAIGITARLKAEIELLFQQSDKKPETKVFRAIKDFKTAYRTACKLAGITGLRFNDWRHGFATDLMERGITVHLAMKLLGHTNPEVHDVYVNGDERLARQAAEALDNLHKSRQGNGFGDTQEKGTLIH